jgi:transposase
MRRYIGCDTHARSCTFAIRDSRGRRLGRDVVETNGRALVDYVRRIPGERHLCLEEGEQSQWLVELLSEHVEQIDVVVPEPRSGNKSDEIDAFELADVVCQGWSWKRVYKDPYRFGRVREASRLYTMVTQDLVRIKNRVKSFYRSRGIAVSGDAVYVVGKREAILRRAPVTTRRALELLYRELDAVEALKAEAQRLLVRESRRHRIARVLETAPGFGEVRVAQLLPIVITPHRFRTKRQFWAYAGLGITMRSSSDWVQGQEGWVRAPVAQTRGLNRNRNRPLKGIFKGAATTVTQHATREPLHEVYFELLDKGIKPNLAKLTIARRIAAIVLAMWKSETPYDPKRTGGG